MTGVAGSPLPPLFIQFSSSPFSSPLFFPPSVALPSLSFHVDLWFIVPCHVSRSLLTWAKLGPGGVSFSVPAREPPSLLLLLLLPGKGPEWDRGSHWVTPTSTTLRITSTSSEASLTYSKNVRGYNRSAPLKSSRHSCGSSVLPCNWLFSSFNVASWFFFQLG